MFIWVTITHLWYLQKNLDDKKNKNIIKAKVQQKQKFSNRKNKKSLEKHRPKIINQQKFPLYNSSPMEICVRQKHKKKSERETN